MPIDWSSVIQHAVTLTHNHKTQKAQENKTYKQKNKRAFFNDEELTSFMRVTCNL